MNPVKASTSLTYTALNVLRRRFQMPAILNLGIGNSGNHFNYNRRDDEPASLIAAHPACPRIRDAELAAIVEAMRRRAGEGDVEAARLIFEIAVFQKQIAAAEAQLAVADEDGSTEIADETTAKTDRTGQTTDHD